MSSKGNNKNKDTYELFKERLDEVNTLRVLCGNMDQWIKKHKLQMMKNSSQNLSDVIVA